MLCTTLRILVVLAYGSLEYFERYKPLKIKKISRKEAYHLPNKAKMPLKIRTQEKTMIVMTPTKTNTECKLTKTVSNAVTFIRAKPAKIHATNKKIYLSK